MISWSSPYLFLTCWGHSSPSSDAMSAPRSGKGCESSCLHFLARGLVLALSEQGSPPFLCSLLHRLLLSSRHPPLTHFHHQLVPTMVLQEPVPSSSQSCRRKSSAAQEPERQHPPSVDSCAVQAPLTPPSGSGRKDSHAQPHTLPRHSSRSTDHGRRQPIQTVVSPTSLAPEHSGTSRPLPRTPRSSSCHSVCRVRLRPELLGVAIVELDILLVGDLDHTDRCDCGAGLVLGVLRPLVSLG